MRSEEESQGQAKARRGKVVTPKKNSITSMGKQRKRAWASVTGEGKKALLHCWGQLRAHVGCLGLRTRARAQFVHARYCTAGILMAVHSSHHWLGPRLPPEALCVACPHALAVF